MNENVSRMPYGVGVDRDDGNECMWQCESLEAAYLTAGIESFEGTAVVVRFGDPVEIIAVYRDGKPDGHGVEDAPA